MAMTNLPVHGQIIRFSKVPQGSYCSQNTDYRVERPRNKGDFTFVRVSTGSSTFDRPWAVARAEWTIQ
jgi:hypothetical protein